MAQATPVSNLADADQMRREIANLGKEYKALQALKKKYSQQAKKNRAEVAKAEQSLAAKLAEIKPALKHGEWKVFLERAHIPRSTADRLVVEHIDPDYADKRRKENNERSQKKTRLAQLLTLPISEESTNGDEAKVSEYRSEIAALLSDDGLVLRLHEIIQAMKAENAINGD